MPVSPLFVPVAPDAHAAIATVVFNGRALPASAGTSIAAALLAAGVRRFRRSPVSGDGRAPYCMMGVCHECLLEVDGVPNRQACLVTVRDGMQLRTQDDLPAQEAGDHEHDPALALAHAMEVPHER